MSHIKRLYRSTKDRIIAGICSGLGRYFNIDANLVRLIWVTVAFIWSGAILAYLVMWLIIPKEADQEVFHAAVA